MRKRTELRGPIPFPCSSDLALLFGIQHIFVSCLLHLGLAGSSPLIVVYLFRMPVRGLLGSSARTIPPCHGYILVTLKSLPVPVSPSHPIWYTCDWDLFSMSMSFRPPYMTHNSGAMPYCHNSTFLRRTLLFLVFAPRSFFP